MREIPAGSARAINHDPSASHEPPEPPPEPSAAAAAVGAAGDGAPWRWCCYVSQPHLAALGGD